MKTNHTNSKGTPKQEYAPEKGKGTWKRVLKIVIGVVLILAALSSESPLSSTCTQSPNMCMGILIGGYTAKVMIFAAGVYLLWKGVRRKK